MPVMLEWAEYTKFFLALLVIVNPVGAVPLFVSMTEQHTVDEKRRIARVASAAVAIVLILAAIAGQPLLAFFGITMASFKVGGAILILLLAISMMHASPTGEKQTPEEAREAEDKESIAVVPLAIPLLTGPATISTVVIYAEQAHTVLQLALLIAYGVVIALATALCLSTAEVIARVLGRTGINVMTRLMGLILAALAVEVMALGLIKLFPALGPP